MPLRFHALASSPLPLTTGLLPSATTSGILRVNWFSDSLSNAREVVATS